MSVSLVIEKAGSEVESIPIVPQRAAKEWSAIGKQFNSQYFDGTFPIYVDASNVAVVISEFEKLARLLPRDHGMRIEPIIERLNLLKSGSDWSASIG